MIVSRPARSVVGCSPIYAPQMPSVVKGGLRNYRNFRSGGLKPGWQHARTTVGWSVDPDGRLIETAINGLRNDQGRGGLHERQTINEVRNPDMSGAVVGRYGAGGSLPQNWNVGFNDANALVDIEDVSTVRGHDQLVLRIHGASSAGQVNIDMTPNNVAACVNGDWYNQSMFVSRVPQPTTGINRIQLIQAYFNSAQNFLSSKAGPNLVDVITDAPIGVDHYDHSQQCTEATAAFVMPQFIVGINNPATADITVTLSAPQLEKRQYATSPIVRSGGPNTRAVDRGNMLPAEWSRIYNSNAGSIFLGGRLLHGTAGTPFPRVLQVDDGGDTNRINVHYDNVDDGRLYCALWSGNVSQITVSPAVVGLLPFRMVAVWGVGSPNEFLWVVNGQIITSEQPTAIPTTFSNLYVFDDVFGRSGSGWCSEFGYEPAAVSKELAVQWSGQAR